jgi:hypothetical protein
LSCQAAPHFYVGLGLISASSFPVQQTQSVFHPHAQRNAFRGGDIQRNDYAKFSRRSHDAVIRVYDSAGNVIETYVLLKNQGLFPIDGLSAP